MSKDKKPAAKGKGAKGKPAKGSAAPRDAGQVRLSEHPRAKRQIAVAKSWAGLLGCGLAGFVSYRSGLPFIDVALRALLWGLAAYMLVWFCAVQVWRHLAVAEVRSAEKQWRERRAEQQRLARERMAQAEAERTSVMAGGHRG
jgi:hypothetical protein